MRAVAQHNQIPQGRGYYRDWKAGQIAFQRQKTGDQDLKIGKEKENGI